MKTYLHDDFLLLHDAARMLYHGHAAPQPIIDYHTHLPPEDLAKDRRWENLTQIWLAGDHYKWRALRACGVAERLITGDATDWEKFEAWAGVVPKTLGNPLHHWTHLELKKPFGIADRLLDAHSARWIWDACREQLATPACSARGLLRQWKVEVVCTTDDPTDNLAHHRALASEPDAGFRMLPSFRPDKAFAAGDPSWRPWLEKLGAAAGVEIRDLDGLKAALASRAAFFHACGCRLSDHGLEAVPQPDPAVRPDEVFRRALEGGPVTTAEREAFAFDLLLELGRIYHGHGWTMQLHLGALRGVNHRLKRLLGADCGGDTIGDFPQAQTLAQLLGALDAEERLPKTILYNLNPADNEVIAAMAYTFQDGSVAGKIQFGSAWWFLDQKAGMERQLEALASLGLLSQFVGMLTDSRSFLSYSRHEYFRRLLCRLLGRQIEEGELPDDLPLAGGMVEDICIRNARRYFSFGGPAS